MTEAEYNAIDAVRSSELVELAKSPKHYAHRKTSPLADTPEFRIGRAVHCYVLEPHAFDQRFVCYREDKAKGEGSRTRWQNFKAEAEATGKTILDVAEHDRAIGAATALLSHPVASQYLLGGLKEHTLTWTDKATGLRCKARIDQAARHLTEVKTARYVDHRRFAAAVASLGYHVRLAMYLDGARQNKLKLDPDPIVLAVESLPPFDVACYRLGPFVMDEGRAEYRRLLGLLKSCLDSNVWPGVCPDDVIDLELPVWAQREEEDVELVLPGGERMAL